MQVDWYLAPQRTSRVVPEATVCFEHVPVPRGEWLLDKEAWQQHDLSERISWLTGMLFVAFKIILRGGDPGFLEFLAGAYREVQETYRLGVLSVTNPASVTDIGAMLRQLAPFADDSQRRALRAVEALQRDLL